MKPPGYTPDSHARSVRLLIPRYIFSLAGRLKPPSVRMRISLYKNIITLSDCTFNTESERNAITVVGVVVVQVAVVVDIPEVVIIARISRTKPPVVGRAT